MGESEFTVLIQAVEDLAAYRCTLLVLNGNRLATAANTAARTGHNLYKIVFHPAIQNRLYQLAGIAKTCCYSTAKRCLAQHKGVFSPAIHTADLTEGIRIRIPALCQEISGS